MASKFIGDIQASSLTNSGTSSLTGDLSITKLAPTIRLMDTDTATGTFGTIEWDSNNTQGVALQFNEFDAELPVAGYGLVLGPSSTNTQFPTTGTLTMNVLGNIYAGGTTLGTVSRVLTQADEGSGNGIDADSVDGIHAGSFLRSDATDTATGAITFDNDIGIAVVYGASDTCYYKGYGMESARTTTYVRPATTAMAATLNIGDASHVWSTVNMNTSSAVNVTGNIIASGDVTAYSDARLKSDVVTIEGALDKVSALRGVDYIKDGKPSTGVIAQEVEEVKPELVHTADDEMGTKSVAYGNMAGLFIEAIKELKDEVAALKAEIAELKK